MLKFLPNFIACLWMIKYLSDPKSPPESVPEHRTKTVLFDHISTTIVRKTDLSKREYWVRKCMPCSNEKIREKKKARIKARKKKKKRSDYFNANVPIFSCRMHPGTVDVALHSCFFASCMVVAYSCMQATGIRACRSLSPVYLWHWQRRPRRIIIACWC